MRRVQGGVSAAIHCVRATSAQERNATQQPERRVKVARDNLTPDLKNLKNNFLTQSIKENLVKTYQQCFAVSQILGL